MEDLRAQTAKGLKAGKTVDQLVEELKFEQYSHWQQYDSWLPENVRGMANRLIRKSR
jgi:hypothetical protein